MNALNFELMGAIEKVGIPTFTEKARCRRYRLRNFAELIRGVLRGKDGIPSLVKSNAIKALDRFGEVFSAVEKTSKRGGSMATGMLSLAAIVLAFPIRQSLSEQVTDCS